MKWVNDGDVWRLRPDSWKKPPATIRKNPVLNKAARDYFKRKHHNSKAGHKKGTSPETSICLDDDDDDNDSHIPESANGSPATVIIHLDDDDDHIPEYDREKYKETDEYKKALAQEMARREEAVRIQAEEARNLRRKRKRAQAEQEMEKRQKRRLEEMRESQDKNAEELNAKEAIRDSISKKLQKLRKSCRSMAALLQGLGVITAGKAPTQSDVRLAYKKALLTFHPDRVSRSDMRLQVEAEEKFKLISRMKDEFRF